MSSTASRAGFLACGLLFAAMLAGCNPSQQAGEGEPAEPAAEATVEMAGHLSDYSRLQLEGDRVLNWRSDSFDPGEFAYIEFAPVTYWLSPSLAKQHPELETDRQRTVALISDLLQQYAGDVIKTGAPGERTLVMQLGFVGLSLEPAYQYTPLDKVSLPGEIKAILTLEMEVRDKESGEQLAAAVQLLEKTASEEVTAEAEVDDEEVEIIIQQFVRQVQTGALFED